MRVDGFSSVYPVFGFPRVSFVLLLHILFHHKSYFSLSYKSLCFVQYCTVPSNGCICCIVAEAGSLECICMACCQFLESVISKKYDSTVYVQIFEARNFRRLLFPNISRKQFSRISSFRYGILKFRELNFRELLESAKTAKITLRENLCALDGTS